MSVRGLIDVSAQRDQAGGPLRAARAPKTAIEAEKTESQGYLDLLITAIPTEPLALYTFVLAGIVSTIDGDDDQRLTMRWIIFGAAVAFIVLWMAAAYVRRPKADKERKLPWAEVSAAVVAFAAWGLAMPESPLGAELSGDDKTVWVVIVTAAGVALLGLLTGSMKKPVKKT